MKGHKYLWGEMSMVREITFIKAEAINLGKMTQNSTIDRQQSTAEVQQS